MAKREMKTQKVEEVVETVEEVVVEDAVVEEPVAEVIIPIGVVSNCSKLNIRKKAKAGSDVVAVVDAKAELTIDPDYTNKDWYKVTTRDGVVGYCMKSYVTIK